GTSEDAEVDGVDGPRPPVRIEAAAAAADADPARHRAGDRLLQWRLALGDENATHVVGSGRVEDLHGQPDVVGIQQPARVDPHDDVVSGVADRGVEAAGRGTGRVVDHADTRVGGSELLGDLR